jgi:hypothetical protein
MVGIIWALKRSGSWRAHAHQQEQAAAEPGSEPAEREELASRGAHAGRDAGNIVRDRPTDDAEGSEPLGDEPGSRAAGQPSS